MAGKRLEVTDVDDKRDSAENHVVVTFSDETTLIYGGRFPRSEDLRAELARAEALERWEAAHK